MGTPEQPPAPVDRERAVLHATLRVIRAARHAAKHWESDWEGVGADPEMDRFYAEAVPQIAAAVKALDAIMPPDGDPCDCVD